jgi:hypothetical protein
MDTIAVNEAGDKFAEGKFTELFPGAISIKDPPAVDRERARSFIRRGIPMQLAADFSAIAEGGATEPKLVQTWKPGPYAPSQYPTAYAPARKAIDYARSLQATGAVSHAEWHMDPGAGTGTVHLYVIPDGKVRSVKVGRVTLHTDSSVTATAEPKREKLFLRIPTVGAK